MPLPFRLHEDAAVDIVDAWQWYERQRSGLGDQFAMAVEATISRACRWPNAGSPTVVDDSGGVVERRIATPGFPYAARYNITNAELVVVAIYHQRRRPDFATERTT